MPKSSNLLLALLIGGVGGGCAVQQLSNREHLLKRLGATATNYVELFETSVEALEHHEEDVFRKVNSALRGVREAGTNCPSVLAQVSRIETIAEAFRADKLAAIKQLRAAADPRTDSVFYYYFKSSSHSEDGWMLTRRGEIMKKVPLH